MKVLMIIRSNAHTTPGGDTVQIEMTAKYLRALGVEVDINFANTTAIPYNNYNLLHFFNIIRPDDILPHINKKIPYVVSTIFVDYAEYEKENRKGILGWLVKNINPWQIEYIKAVARWIKNGDRIRSTYYLLNGHQKAIRTVVSSAKLLLPNSNSEYMRFSKAFNLHHSYTKVVNAIDPDVFSSDHRVNRNYENHVLCVGRIEGRKNQLNLIKALMGTELQLTIIGKPSPNHIHYFNECKQVAATANNIHFIDHIDHANLVSIYKAAKVHALVSWFETTGLSSLEAGVMDCNLVVTKKGDTEEYFGDMAYYCEPDDVTSIREAVMRAYYAPINPLLKEKILNCYTWKHTAEQTLNAYKQALEH